MKIKAPLSGLSEVKDLCESGIDEIYTGLLPGNSYSIPFIYNDRLEYDSNLHGFQELRDAIAVAKKYNVKVSVAVNLRYYDSDTQRDNLYMYLEQLSASDIDSIIVNDINVFLILKKLRSDKKLILSCLANPFNSYAIHFYKQFGVNRITLPRHLTLEEIVSIRSSHPDVDFEVFIALEKCRNINGLCGFFHYPYGICNTNTLSNLPRFFHIYVNKILCGLNGKNILRFAYRYFVNKYIQAFSPCRGRYNINIETYVDITQEERDIIIQNINSQFRIADMPACGLCALKLFNDIGIKSVKIAGRSMTRRRYKYVYISLIKRCLSLAADKNLRYKEYVSKVKELVENAMERECTPFGCYYPDLVENMVSQDRAKFNQNKCNIE